MSKEPPIIRSLRRQAQTAEDALLRAEAKLAMALRMMAAEGACGAPVRCPKCERLLLPSEKEDA